MSANKGPTYGELLEMLKRAERKASQSHGCTSQLLLNELKGSYPDIPIGRPGRFLDTVKRIAAPTLTGKGKLGGTPLRSYLKRQWSPRIRNTTTQGSLMYSLHNYYKTQAYICIVIHIHALGSQLYLQQLI